MTRASAIYEGWVAHRRHRPSPHAFRYPIFLPLFDLAELPDVLDEFALWSARRAAPAWFRRADFLGEPGETIAASAQRLLADRLGRRPSGPVRLLAHPRYLGVGFNPVSPPGEELRIGFRNVEGGVPVFEASLALRRREMDRRLMARVLRTYPPQTITTLARIYLHALRLRIRGAPWFAHPTAAA